MNFFKKLFSPQQAITQQYYLCICCIIKDENAYLEEWINYHLKVGVEHFYIYDNGSKIPIANTIRQIGMDQYATVRTIRGKAMQVKAYGDCLKRFGQTSQWIAFIDTDEFILSKNEGHQLPAFLKDYEPYGGLGVNWLIFGSNGHTKRTQRPQLESFTMRSEVDFHVNRHIKSIVQPRFVQSSKNAHSFNYITGKFCVNENFKPVEGAFSEPSVNKIQLNHYYCRSMEEFDEKINRGIADTRKKRTLEQFHHHDDEGNKVEDRLILEIK